MYVVPTGTWEHPLSWHQARQYRHHHLHWEWWCAEISNHQGKQWSYIHRCLNQSDSDGVLWDWRWVTWHDCRWMSSVHCWQPARSMPRGIFLGIADLIIKALKCPQLWRHTGVDYYAISDALAVQKSDCLMLCFKYDFLTTNIFGHFYSPTVANKAFS